MRKIVKMFSLLIFYLSVSGQEKGCLKRCDSITNTEIYDVVEILPEPVGGLENLHHKLRESIKIDSISDDIFSIKAGVAFIVCPDGKIIGERILHDNTNQVGFQMLEIAKEMYWSAGMCDNKKVPALFKIPLIACFR